MNTLHKYITQISATLAVLLLVACQTAPPCEYDEVTLKANFYKVKQSVLKDTTFAALSVYIGTDTLEPLFKNKAVNAVQLPLSMQADSSVFLFRYDSISFDTLIIKHTFDLKLVSHECGFVGFFNIEEVLTSNTKIDSIRIPKKLVDYDIQENIRIHF
jgi:hypothetical protein